MTPALAAPLLSGTPTTLVEDVLQPNSTALDPGSAFADLLALLPGAEMIPSLTATEGNPAAEGLSATEDEVVSGDAAVMQAFPGGTSMPWPSGLDRALALTLRTAGSGVLAMQHTQSVAPASVVVVGAGNGATATTTTAGTSPAVAPEPAATPDFEAGLPSAVRGERTTPSVPVEGAAELVMPVVQSAASIETAESVLPLPAGRTELWKRPLAQALGERLQYQMSQGVEQARIRLDPPTLGRIEILLRQEGGQLQVHLSASHSDVARQLQLMGDGLRQELSQRHGAQVTVSVHDTSTLGDSRLSQQPHQQQQQQQRQPGQEVGEEPPGQALRSESPAGAIAFSLA